LPTTEVTTLLDRLTQSGAEKEDAEQLVRRLVQEGKITKYQAVHLYQGHGKGLVFGEYVVLDKIGAGGMGKVYKAVHRKMKRITALKVLPPHVSQNPKIVQRFFREMEVAAKLVHPNIVAAYDSGESRGLHYLVMEFVDGVDLATHVDRHGPLSVADVVNYMLQTARGLEYAHGESIIHRDVKPANLLLDKAGTVKILDLGLARICAPDDETGAAPNVLTVEGEMLGTADYMAPEQSQDTHSADHRADIYSLACTLYRLLTGNPPYPAETTVGKIMAHHDKPIPSLQAARPEVPDALEALHRRMMAKRPDDRPQSMTEVIAVLQSLRF
jgi:serine/threonine protein kinase